jgi:hypothetical protein
MAPRLISGDGRRIRVGAMAVDLGVALIFTLIFTLLGAVDVYE